MNNNAWFKKEMPLQTVIGFGGGATGFGAHSSVASKPYIDDVFSTYLYAGNETVRSIDNGIDLSTKNGLVWVKARNDTHQHHLFDTVRGANELISSDADSDQSTVANRVTAFNNNGFTLGTAGQVNGTNAYEYSSWTFREQAGFFDIVQYTGNGSNRNISHDLGCKPGCIMIKRTDDPQDWIVYHNGFYDFQASDHYYLKLNSTVGQQYGGSVWNNTAPTTTNFRIGQSTAVNQTGGTYIAYLFGGGSDRTTDTSCSVNFNGSAELTVPSSTDFDFGSGDFTIECWVTHGGSSNMVYINRSYYSASSNSSWLLFGNGNGNVDFYATTSTGWTYQVSAPATINDNQWHHIAVVRTDGYFKIYVDGDLRKTQSVGSNAIPDSTRVVEIGTQWNSAYLTGKISNLRVVKGTAVYTSSFIPSTAPLTNISGTVLLCCQSTTVTTATVTPGTITTDGTPTSSIVTPFIDPGSFTLGENEDKNGIKCGIYQGNGSSTGPEVFIGWEPQYLLIKNVNSSESWALYDAMRGISSGRDDVGLYPNGTYAEYSADVMELTSTGFKLKSSAADLNESTSYFVYIAIRRPDGHVGKLPSAATNVFAMDTWVSNSTPATEPNMISNFPVDFVIDTDPNHSSGGWEGDRYVRTRLFSDNLVYANKNDVETYGTWGFFDYSTGWFNRQGLTGYTDWMSWMWKRGQGIDVVTYKGNALSKNDGGHNVPHGLAQIPEMIMVKRRDVTTANWGVYHIGLNGGTNPQESSIALNSSAASDPNSSEYWGDKSPTSTHFTLGDTNAVNNSSSNYIAILFASANNADGDPISKVGYYSGSSSSVTVTTGFQPRFVIIKRATGVGQWTMFDTFRGWTAGNDQMLELSDNAAQSSSFDYGEPTATGFTITTGQSATNNNGDTYIYYAHA